MYMYVVVDCRETIRCVPKKELVLKSSKNMAFQKRYSTFNNFYILYRKNLDNNKFNVWQKTPFFCEKEVFWPQKCHLVFSKRSIGLPFINMCKHITAQATFLTLWMKFPKQLLVGRNYCKTVYILVSYSTLFSYQDGGIKNVFWVVFTVHLLQCIFFTVNSLHTTCWSQISWNIGNIYNIFEIYAKCNKIFNSVRVYTVKLVFLTF